MHTGKRSERRRTEKEPPMNEEESAQIAAHIAAIVAVAEQIAQVVEQLKRIASALEEANKKEPNNVE
jgi:chaperonin cofactor prefoldin